MNTFTLPDLGEGLAESEIVQWHVNVGEVVKVDQLVVTVETAKAIVEVPSPYDGKIIGRFGNEGDIIDIGTLLLQFEEAEENAHASKTEKHRQDVATVVGHVTQHDHHVDVDNFWVGSVQKSQQEQNITALPSARLLAQKLGIDLERVSGSGQNGVITDSDVYNSCEHQQPGTEVLKGARRTMVGTMTESHDNVAAVTITEEAMLDNWASNEDISIRLIHAIIFACQQESALNAWFDPKTMTRCVHKTVNVGIAVDSPQGLYVPVLKNADTFNAKEMRHWLDRTVEGIKARKIGREQLQHATITLTNFGAIAGIYATPVVSLPQVCIVGAGRIIEKVAIKNGQAVAVKALPLSITFDHRACTGGEAARFTKALVTDLEKRTEQDDLH